MANIHTQISMIVATFLDHQGWESQPTNKLPVCLEISGLKRPGAGRVAFRRIRPKGNNQEIRFVFS
jgi:hypothetical protein